MGLRRRLRRLLGGPPPLGDRVPAAPPPAVPAAPPGPWSLSDASLAGPVAPLLRPEVLAALADDTLGALATPLAPGLHTLQLFTDEGRTRLLAEIASIEDAVENGRLLLDAPNSMHVHGVQLAQVGLDALAQSLCVDVVQPLARALLHDLGPLTLGDAHGFTVSYGARRDRDLAFHVDDSTVTLNLCLVQRGRGAEVVFEGVRCPAHRQERTDDAERVVWRPQTGEALIHLGAHRHSTRPIEHGHRTSLIVWCRDRRRPALAACGPWCGSPEAPR